jgi:hypothetical protein
MFGVNKWRRFTGVINGLEPCIVSMDVTHERELKFYTQ